jgi:4-amino-4-deoxy-L-arabinose transferase-like glycosyltransferase
MAFDGVCGSRQHAQALWAQHKVTLIVLTLTLLGAALRLYEINANGFNNDEAFSIWVAGHSIPRIIQFTTLGGGDPSSPPLHFLLLHALLPLGDQPLVVRSLSVLAGTLIVWVTFHLALELFDLRVATLSAFLMAIAPLHIAYSRVARPHILSDLWALLSLYLLARLFFHQERRWDWIGLVVVMALAIWTFPSTFFVAVFENVYVAFLWLRQRVSRQRMIKWLVSQAAVGILVVPVLLVGPAEVSGVGLEWLSRPGLQDLLKTAILLSTGDPSHGPTGVTPARILSLLAIVSLAILGVWLFLRRGYHRQLDNEGQRVLFVLGAFLIPWLTVFVASQVHPMYRERYFLFVMPPLFILFAWIFARAKYSIPSLVTLCALVCLTGCALFVYNTEPWGEQWREVVAYMRPAYRSDDVVVISPGHYNLPFAYYFSGAFPENAASLERIPAVVLENGSYRALGLVKQAGDIRIDDPALATAERIWFVSGYAPVDPTMLARIQEGFAPEDTGVFLGARVCLLQRTQGAGTDAANAGE